MHDMSIHVKLYDSGAPGGAYFPGSHRVEVDSGLEVGVSTA